jgi:hypothetical protein
MLTSSILLRMAGVTVPLHAGETIGPGLLRSILSQAGVTAHELRRVLPEPARTHQTDQHLRPGHEQRRVRVLTR